jgi:hypothetical protein
MSAAKSCFRLAMAVGRVHALQRVFGNGDVEHVGRDRAEAGLVGREPCRSCAMRHQRAAVEAARRRRSTPARPVKGARDLHRVLDRLGAGGDEQPSSLGRRSAPGVSLFRRSASVDHALVGSDRGKLVCVKRLELLAASRPPWTRMAVAGVEHRDAGGEVDVFAAVRCPTASRSRRASRRCPWWRRHAGRPHAGGSRGWCSWTWRLSGSIYGGSRISIARSKF